MATGLLCAPRCGVAAARFLGVSLVLLLILFQILFPVGGGGGLVAKSCLTPCDPMDCSLLGSSVHGTLQARVLEGVAISFSRGSSQPRDQTQVSCIAGRFFTS